MRVVITGGTGFVGYHLARQLENSGDSVTSVSSMAAERKQEVRDFRLLDIRDGKELDSLFTEKAPHHIYHLAAISSISAATQDERSAFDVNVWGTRNVLAGAAKLGGDVRVLNVSTSQVYGESHRSPLGENSPVSPQNAYATTKAMGELLCSQYSPKIEVVIARPFNHSGPGQSAGYVLSYLAHRIAAIEAGDMKPVIRTGNLLIRRDFTDVRDVVRAYQLMMIKGRSGQTYNICSGNAYLLSDALEILLSFSSAKIDVELDPSKSRKGEAASIEGDASKLHSDTGWVPTISFAQMLFDILEYWRKGNGSDLSKAKTTPK